MEMVKPHVKVSKVILHCNCVTKPRTITESLIGTLARNTDADGSWFANQMVHIFMDKPENCKEISTGELIKLLPDFENVEEFREHFGNLLESIDKNQDNIVSCYGDLKNRSIYHLSRNT